MKRIPTKENSFPFYRKRSNILCSLWRSFLYLKLLLWFAWRKRLLKSLAFGDSWGANVWSCYAFVGGRGRLFPTEMFSSRIELNFVNLASTNSRLMNIWKLRWDDYQGWTVLSGVLFFCTYGLIFWPRKIQKLPTWWLYLLTIPYSLGFIKAFLKDRFLPRFGVASFFLVC